MNYIWGRGLHSRNHLQTLGEVCVKIKGLVKTEATFTIMLTLSIFIDQPRFLSPEEHAIQQQSVLMAVQHQEFVCFFLFCFKCKEATLIHNSFKLSVFLYLGVAQVRHNRLQRKMKKKKKKKKRFSEWVIRQRTKVWLCVFWWKKACQP